MKVNFVFFNFKIGEAEISVHSQLSKIIRIDFEFWIISAKYLNNINIQNNYNYFLIGYLFVSYHA